MTIIAVPSKGNGGLNDAIEKRFGKCESITLVSLKNKNIESVKIIPILSSDVMGNRGLYVANLIENNNALTTLLRYIGNKSYNSLKAQNIQIFHISIDNLKIKKCIELYIKGKLPILSESNSHLIKD